MIPVKPHVAERAWIKGLDQYEALYRRSIEDPHGFWKEQSQIIDWFHEPRGVMDMDMDEVDFAWYSGGRLNASYNCVDRHLATQGEKTAIIWAGDEPGEYRYISYRDLKHNVARIANVLLSLGVRKGDRVCIYLPMIPELAYTMLACARIGAVHSVVFAGFSAESLRGRILDAGAKMVVTANEGLRGGKRIPLKATVDQAIEGMGVVEKVLVARRTDREVAMKSGRDLWLEDETHKQRSTCPLEWMSAEDPLFTLYTSGSTGRPKGVLHTTGGYMVYAALTHKYVFDIHPDDIYMCAADIGWITGHSYILYGPLANGATTVMFESIPTYPDPGRYWRIVDDLDPAPHLPPGILGVLAVLQGDEVAQLLEVFLQEHLEAEEEAGPFGDGRGRPPGEGRLGRLHRAVDVLFGGERGLAYGLAGGGIVDGLRLAAVAVRPLAAYKVTDFVGLLGCLHRASFSWASHPTPGCGGTLRGSSGRARRGRS